MYRMNNCMRERERVLFKFKFLQFLPGASAWVVAGGGIVPKESEIKGNNAQERERERQTDREGRREGGRERRKEREGGISYICSFSRKCS